MTHARQLLREWADEHGGYSAARLLIDGHPSRSQLWRWATGQCEPPVTTALAIERASGGAVPVHSWRRPADHDAQPA